MSALNVRESLKFSRILDNRGRGTQHCDVRFKSGSGHGRFVHA